MSPVARTAVSGLVIAGSAAGILWTLARFRLAAGAPRGELKAWQRATLRALVSAAGILLSLWSLTTFRIADWPLYVAFMLLSVVLYVPSVEVLPSLTLPIPALAVIIGFLYVIGPPILVLRNVAPIVSELLRRVLPERWKTLALDLRNEPVAALLRRRSAATSGIPGDWAEFGQFNLGLAVRWWIVTALAASGQPTSHPVAIAVAELGGYAVWGVLSLLPIYRYNVFYSHDLYWPPGSPPSEQVVRTALQDVGLIHLFALTPFVLLIAYGYEAHGPVGAAAWSLASLGLHFMLQRLNERRLVVEEQNGRLAALNRELEHRERLSAIGKMSSVISHQMLQELGVIGIHADLIRHGEGEPAAAMAQAKANAAAIEDALRGVNRVMTDLLVFSRDLRLNLYEHRLRDVLAECIEACRPQAAGRGVALRLECPADASARLDKLKIRQAVVNVLRNAIEASPPDAEVLVRCSLADGALEIAVTDRGPGILEADRQAVFTPFFTTKEHGSGLGLAIAREFAEAHGGGITVEARDGGGATFVLRLRREGPAAA